MFDHHAAWFIIGVVIVIPIINALLRRRKTAVPAKLLPEDEVRPAHIPMTYSWDDWIKDIYSTRIPTDLIMEKIRWCGMPKRPKPETVTVPTSGITSATPIDINVGGATTTGTPASVTSIWVGGIGSQTNVPWWGNQISNVSGYYNGSNVTFGGAGTYRQNSTCQFYPNYSSQFYGTCYNSSSINTTFHV